ncbi:Hvo_1808 family surface protein [Halapricum desulfuricans]|nr:Hvo_1808 family surface protein [Halapricum desulfuricans]
MGFSRLGLALAIASLAVIASGTVGSAALADDVMAASTSDTDAENSTGEDATTSMDRGTLPDPPEDRIGWEGGYWYNESIHVEQSDGLSAAELRRYKYRTMARLEEIRGLEFTDDVEIEFIGTGAVADRLDNNISQFRGSDRQWEALFVVGEDREADRVVFETLVGRVAGWAAEEGSESVVLITDDPDEPTAPPRLLAHELAHVLQHQQFDLDADRYRRETLDGEHAKDALVEGEASYLDGVYQQYCANGSWDCVNGGSFATARGDVERDLLPYLGAPYTLGSQYVGHLVDRGGFEAVGDAHRNPPEYSVTALHGERTESGRRAGIAPASPLTVPDRSSDEWTRRDDPDRVGAMALTASIGDDALAWRNDALYSYTDGSADGYVWATRWSNETTAEAFAEAYRQRVRSHGGTQRTAAVWEITTGPFADAFSIERAGDTVRIVNAPAVADLDAIHAGAGPSEQDDSTPTPRNTASKTSVGDTGPPTSSGPTATETSPATADGDGPGFGVVASLVALFAVGVARRKTT